MSGDPLVNFIIAGVQKGGTTALFDYLGDEPGVALPRIKEVHFFDDDAHDWSRPDYATYHANWDAPGGRPTGEATPIYLYWPNSLERIAAYNPAMKLVVLLRDPVQRAWSHWRMEYARQLETHPFAWCIREGRRRLLDAEPAGYHRVFSYVERGFYAAQLERLFGIFPREQVLILKAEDLRADPGPSLAAVRAFTGLPSGPAPAPREVHVGPRTSLPSQLTPEDVRFLRELYAPDMERLRELTGVSFD